MTIDSKLNTKRSNNTLSICLIVKNEELVLDRCLQGALKIADEIIVVDTGSSDHTIEIAKKYTDNLYTYKWDYNFANARNFSFSKATCDYVMWLDADEIIDEENAQRFNSLMDNIDNDIDIVSVKLQQYSEDGVYWYLLRERIFKRSISPKWESDVHETVIIEPNHNVNYRNDISIIHKKEVVNEKTRNINILDKVKTKNGTLDIYESSDYCTELALSKEYDKAYQLYKKICLKQSRERRYTTFFYVHAGLMRQKRYEECLAELEVMNRDIFKTAFSVYKQAVCLEKLGRIDEAEKLYLEATEIKGDIITHTIQVTGYNDYFPLLRLAMIESKRGNNNKALEYVKKASINYPNHKDWKIVEDAIMAN